VLQASDDRRYQLPQTQKIAFNISFLPLFSIPCDISYCYRDGVARGQGILQRSCNQVAIRTFRSHHANAGLSSVAALDSGIKRGASGNHKNWKG